MKECVTQGIEREQLPLKGRRLWPDQLAAAAAELVMLVRSWMLDELSSPGAVQGATAIWSQWNGYLREGSGKEFEADCTRRWIPFRQIHTSGHASSVDLKRLAQAIDPAALVPIHTYGADSEAPEHGSFLHQFDLAAVGQPHVVSPTIPNRHADAPVVQGLLDQIAVPKAVSLLFARTADQDYPG